MIFLYECRTKGWCPYLLQEGCLVNPPIPYQELVPLSTPAGCLLDPRFPYQEMVPLSAPAGCLLSIGHSFPILRV